MIRKLSPVLLFPFWWICARTEAQKAKEIQDKRLRSAIHNFYKAHGQVMPAAMFCHLAGGAYFPPSERINEMVKIRRQLDKEGKEIWDYAD